MESLCFIGLSPVIATTIRSGGTCATTTTPSGLRLGHLQTQTAITDMETFECRQSMLGIFHRAEVEERKARLAAPYDAQWLHVAVADLCLELTHTYRLRQRADVHRAFAVVKETTPISKAAAALALPFRSAATACFSITF